MEIISEKSFGQTEIIPDNIEKTEDLCIDSALSCPVNAIEIGEY